jgi:hypothetical protein
MARTMTKSFTKQKELILEKYENLNNKILE